MATLERLKQALVDADAAGDTEAAQAFADAIRAGQYDDYQPPQETETTPTAEESVEQPIAEEGPYKKAATALASDIGTAGEAAGAGALEFMAGVNRAAVDLIDFLGPDQINAILQLSGSETRVPTLGEQEIIQEGTRGGFVESPIAREALQKAGEFSVGGAATGALLRGAAGSIPALASRGEKVGRGILRQLGQTTAAADIGAGALAGVGSVVGREAGEAVAGPEGAQVGEFLGAAAAPAIPALVGGATRAARAATGFGPQQATRQTQIAEEVIKAGEERGIPVLTTDVIKPKTWIGRAFRDLGEKIPFVGTGGQRAAQQSAREEALEAIDNATPPINARAIFESLQGSVNKVKQAAGKRIEGVVNEMDRFGSVPIRNTVKAIDEAIAIQTRPGKIRNEALINDLQGLKTTLSEAPQNFGQLREFRTDLRAQLDRIDPAGRTQFRSRAKALADRIYKGVTQDLDKFVKANIGTDQTAMREFKRYKSADVAWGQEARTLTKSKLKNVLDKGDVEPELVTNILLNSNKSQLDLLHRNLDSAGRQNARLALMRNALDKATVKGQVNVDRFTTQLNKYRKQFDVFFRGENKSELEGFKRALTYTGRAQQAPVTTATGQALLLPLGLAGGATMPMETILGAGAIGSMARVYESKGIRDLLIRIAKTKKGSETERRLVNSLGSRLQEAARDESFEQMATETEQQVLSR